MSSKMKSIEMKSIEMRACEKNLGSIECRNELEKIINESLRNVLSKKEEYMFSRHPELFEGYDGEYSEMTVKMNNSKQAITESDKKMSREEQIFEYLKQIEEYNEKNIETLEDDIEMLLKDLEKKIRRPFASTRDLKDYIKTIKKTVKKQFDGIKDSNKYYYENAMKELM